MRGLVDMGISMAMRKCDRECGGVSIKIFMALNRESNVRNDRRRNRC